MDDFYVYLPSNVKSDYFENTAANYKTKLAKKLDINYEYYVGLSEVSYTHRIMNIFEDEVIKIRYYTNEGSINEKIDILEKGSYTINNLIDAINKLLDFKILKSRAPKLEIKYDRKVEIVNIKLGYNSYGLIFPLFSGNLLNMLGLNRENYEKFMNRKLNSYLMSARLKEIFKGIEIKNNLDIDEDYLAERPYDMTSGIHTLFIYCDIIKPHLVGDSYSQLLKYVEIPNNLKYGDQVHILFPNIQYFPIQITEFESIEIHMKDDTGKDISFGFAKNIIVLHFKKRINKKNKME